MAEQNLSEKVNESKSELPDQSQLVSEQDEKYKISSSSSSSSSSSNHSSSAQNTPVVPIPSMDDIKKKAQLLRKEEFLRDIDLLKYCYNVLIFADEYYQCIWDEQIKDKIGDWQTKYIEKLASLTAGNSSLYAIMEYLHARAELAVIEGHVVRAQVSVNKLEAMSDTINDNQQARDTIIYKNRQQRIDKVQERVNHFQEQTLIYHDTYLDFEKKWTEIAKELQNKLTTQNLSYTEATECWLMLMEINQSAINLVGGRFGDKLKPRLINIESMLLTTSSYFYNMNKSLAEEKPKELEEKKYEVVTKDGIEKFLSDFKSFKNEAKTSSSKEISTVDEYKSKVAVAIKTLEKHLTPEAVLPDAQVLKNLMNHVQKAVVAYRIEKILEDSKLTKDNASFLESKLIISKSDSSGLQTAKSTITAALELQQSTEQLPANFSLADYEFKLRYQIAFLQAEHQIGKFSAIGETINSASALSLEEKIKSPFAIAKQITDAKAYETDAWGVFKEKSKVIERIEKANKTKVNAELLMAELEEELLEHKWAYQQAIRKLFEAEMQLGIAKEIDKNSINPEPPIDPHPSVLNVKNPHEVNSPLQKAINALDFAQAEVKAIAEKIKAIELPIADAKDKIKKLEKDLKESKDIAENYPEEKEVKRSGFSFLRSPFSSNNFSSPFNSRGKLDSATLSTPGLESSITSQRSRQGFHEKEPFSATPLTPRIGRQSTPVTENSLTEISQSNLHSQTNDLVSKKLTELTQKQVAEKSKLLEVGLEIIAKEQKIRQASSFETAKLRQERQILVKSQEALIYEVQQVSKQITELKRKPAIALSEDLEQEVKEEKQELSVSEAKSSIFQPLSIPVFNDANNITALEREMAQRAIGLFTRILDEQLKFVAAVKNYKLTEQIKSQLQSITEDLGAINDCVDYLRGRFLENGPITIIDPDKNKTKVLGVNKCHQQIQKLRQEIDFVSSPKTKNKKDLTDKKQTELTASLTRMGQLGVKLQVLCHSKFSALLHLYNDSFVDVANRNALGESSEDFKRRLQTFVEQPANLRKQTAAFIDKQKPKPGIFALADFFARYGQTLQQGFPSSSPDQQKNEPEEEKLSQPQTSELSQQAIREGQNDRKQQIADYKAATQHLTAESPALRAALENLDTDFAHITEGFADTISKLSTTKDPHTIADIMMSVRQRFAKFDLLVKRVSVLMEQLSPTSSHPLIPDKQQFITTPEEKFKAQLQRFDRLAAYFEPAESKLHNPEETIDDDEPDAIINEVIKENKYESPSEDEYGILNAALDNWEWQDQVIAKNNEALLNKAQALMKKLDAGLSGKNNPTLKIQLYNKTVLEMFKLEHKASQKRSKISVDQEKTQELEVLGNIKTQLARKIYTYCNQLTPESMQRGKSELSVRAIVTLAKNLTQLSAYFKPHELKQAFTSVIAILDHFSYKLPIEAQKTLLQSLQDLTMGSLSQNVELMPELQKLAALRKTLQHRLNTSVFSVPDKTQDFKTSGSSSGIEQQELKASFASDKEEVKERKSKSPATAPNLILMQANAEQLVKAVVDHKLQQEIDVTQPGWDLPWQQKFISFIDDIRDFKPAAQITEPSAELKLESKGSAVAKLPAKLDSEITALDDLLKDYQQAALGRISKMVEVPTVGRVRFFPPRTGGNILLEKAEIFTNALDTARAVLNHLQDFFPHYRSPAAAQQVLLEVKKCLIKFHKNISHGTVIEAGKELENFNGALCSSLVTHGLRKNFKQATEVVAESRDLMLEREQFASVIPVPKMVNLDKEEEKKENKSTVSDNQNNGFMVRFARPAKLGLPADVNDPYDAFKSRGWFTAAQEKIPGLEYFIEKNQHRLRTEGRTSMRRVLPGAANSYFSSILLGDDEGHLKLYLNSGHVAITESIALGGEDRSLTAATNQFGFLIGEEGEIWESIIKQSHERWKFLDEYRDENEERAHTLLVNHQTLVSEVPLISADMNKSGTMLITKESANRNVAQWLGNKQTYLVDGEVQYFTGDKKPPAREGVLKVNTKLLETNINVNRTNVIQATRRTVVGQQRDSDASKQIVSLAAELLLLVSKHPALNPQKANLLKVIDFLNGTKKPVFSKNDAESDIYKAIKECTNYLRQPDHEKFGGLNKQQNTMIAMVIQAAAEIHSMQMGDSLRRSKLSQKNKLRHTAKRAIYEALLSELIGYLLGGCASSQDRAQNNKGGVMAQISANENSGSFIDLDSSISIEHAQKIGLIPKYPTQEQHNFAFQTTRTPQTKTGELRGGIGLVGTANLESAEERELSKILQRKFTANEITVQKYLSKRPANIQTNTEKLKPKPTEMELTDLPDFKEPLANRSILELKNRLQFVKNYIDRTGTISNQPLSISFQAAMQAIEELQAKGASNDSLADAIYAPVLLKMVDFFSKVQATLNNIHREELLALMVPFIDEVTTAFQPKHDAGTLSKDQEKILLNLTNLHENLQGFLSLSPSETKTLGQNSFIERTLSRFPSQLFSSFNQSITPIVVNRPGNKNTNSDSEEEIEQTSPKIITVKELPSERKSRQEREEKSVARRGSESSSLSAVDPDPNSRNVTPPVINFSVETNTDSDSEKEIDQTSPKVIQQGSAPSSLSTVDTNSNSSIPATGPRTPQLTITPPSPPNNPSTETDHSSILSSVSLVNISSDLKGHENSNNNIDTATNSFLSSSVSSASTNIVTPLPANTSSVLATTVSDVKESNEDGEEDEVDREELKAAKVLSRELDATKNIPPTEVTIPAVTQEQNDDDDDEIIILDIKEPKDQKGSKIASTPRATLLTSYAEALNAEALNLAIENSVRDNISVDKKRGIPPGRPIDLSEFKVDGETGIEIFITDPSLFLSSEDLDDVDLLSDPKDNPFPKEQPEIEKTQPLVTQIPAVGADPTHSGSSSSQVAGSSSAPVNLSASNNYMIPGNGSIDPSGSNVSSYGSNTTEPSEFEGDIPDVEEAIRRQHSLWGAGGLFTGGKKTDLEEPLLGESKEHNKGGNNSIWARIISLFTWSQTPKTVPEKIGSRFSFSNDDLTPIYISQPKERDSENAEAISEISSHRERSLVGSDVGSEDLERGDDKNKLESRSYSASRPLEQAVSKDFKKKKEHKYEQDENEYIGQGGGNNRPQQDIDEVSRYLEDKEELIFQPQARDDQTPPLESQPPRGFWQKAATFFTERSFSSVSEPLLTQSRSLDLDERDNKSEQDAKENKNPGGGNNQPQPNINNDGRPDADRDLENHEGQNAQPEVLDDDDQVPPPWPQPPRGFWQRTAAFFSSGDSYYQRQNTWMHRGSLALSVGGSLMVGIGAAAAGPLPLFFMAVPDIPTLMGVGAFLYGVTFSQNMVRYHRTNVDIALLKLAQMQYILEQEEELSDRDLLEIRRFAKHLFHTIDPNTEDGRRFSIQQDMGRGQVLVVDTWNSPNHLGRNRNADGRLLQRIANSPVLTANDRGELLAIVNTLALRPNYIGPPEPGFLDRHPSVKASLNPVGLVGGLGVMMVPLVMGLNAGGAATHFIDLRPAPDISFAEDLIRLVNSFIVLGTVTSGYVSFICREAAARLRMPFRDLQDFAKLPINNGDRNPRWLQMAVDDNGNILHLQAIDMTRPSKPLLSWLKELASKIFILPLSKRWEKLPPRGIVLRYVNIGVGAIVVALPIAVPASTPFALATGIGYFGGQLFKEMVDAASNRLFYPQGVPYAPNPAPPRLPGQQRQDIQLDFVADLGLDQRPQPQQRQAPRPMQPLQLLQPRDRPVSIVVPPRDVGPSSPLTAILPPPANFGSGRSDLVAQNGQEEIKERTPMSLFFTPDPKPSVIVPRSQSEPLPQQPSVPSGDVKEIPASERTRLLPQAHSFAINSASSGIPVTSSFSSFLPIQEGNLPSPNALDSSFVFFSPPSSSHSSSAAPSSSSSTSSISSSASSQPSEIIPGLAITDLSLDTPRDGSNLTDEAEDDIFQI